MPALNAPGTPNLKWAKSAETESKDPAVEVAVLYRTRPGIQGDPESTVGEGIHKPVSVSIPGVSPARPRTTSDASVGRPAHAAFLVTPATAELNYWRNLPTVVKRMPYGAVRAAKLVPMCLSLFLLFYRCFG